MPVTFEVTEFYKLQVSENVNWYNGFVTGIAFGFTGDSVDTF